MKTLCMLLMLSFSLSCFSKTIVISDIDDTIKTSNSMGVLGQLYHFLRMGSYPAMSLLYQDIQSEHLASGVEFIYVSAAPDAIYDQDAWLNSKNFPKGESYLRASILEDTYEYKMRTIRKILESRDLESNFIFFGDNSSKDRRVYEDIVTEFKIKDYSIYIRDVSTIDTFVNNATSTSFFTELELLKEFPFLRKQTVFFINELASSRKLLPLYTVETLKRELRDQKECFGFCVLAHHLIDVYFTQF